MVDDGSYGWDNEYGSRTLSVPAFEASKHMISNGEFLEFVKDAGYARREFWTESGWGWKTFRNAKWPKFWIPQVGGGRGECNEAMVEAKYPTQTQYLPQTVLQSTALVL